MSVGLPIGHAVRPLCGYQSMICGYAIRRGMVIRHAAFWCPAVGIFLWIVVLTSYAASHRIFL